MRDACRYMPAAFDFIAVVICYQYVMPTALHLCLRIFAIGSSQCQVAARQIIGSNKVLKRNVNPGRDAMASVMHPVTCLPAFDFIAVVIFYQYVMPTALRLRLRIFSNRKDHHNAKSQRDETLVATRCRSEM